ncbi:MAG: hypothetical protein LBD42_03290, partial [Desulfovibrio sp.]|nr:hypothetical protein [Desulfovibrio sp.]
MAPESNASRPAATAPSRQNVTVPVPNAGAELVVNSSAGGQLQFAFDPSAATTTRSGNDLAFELDGGGKVMVKDFFVVGDESLPSLRMPDGVVVASADFFAASGLDMTTAAGPGGGNNASSGSGEYLDDAGNLIGGIDRFGKLGTDFWGRGIESSDTYVVRETPGGSFDLGGNSYDGDGFFVTAGMYEDWRPEQHTGDYDTRLFGKLDFTFTPMGSTVVDAVHLSGFDAGTTIIIGTPRFDADGNLLNGVVVSGPNQPFAFTHDNFASDGVYVLPPANSDHDMTIAISVDIRAVSSGVLGVVNGTCVIIVDAVADQPFVRDAAFDDMHLVGQVDTVERTVVEDEHDYDGLGHHLTEQAASGQESVEVSVPFETTVRFADYMDGSEAHYVLIEVPHVPAGADWGCVDASGNPAGTITGPDGKEYFQVPVGNADIAAAGGEITVNVTLTVTGDSATVKDTPIHLNVGAMAEEHPGDGELTLDNNVSFDWKEGGEDFTLDVVDGGLKVTAGWASEGDNDAKHLGRTSDAYASGTAQGAGTDNAPGGAINTGAPIVIEVGVGSTGQPEAITSVVFDYDASEGHLFYNGVDLDPTGSGHVLIEAGALAPPLNDPGKLEGVQYRPNEDSFSDRDVPLQYRVNVENGAGVTGSYSGGITVVVDAVADLSSAVESALTGGSDAQHFADNGQEIVADSQTHDAQGWENDQFGMDYSNVEYSFSLSVTTSFPDTDGSENHYVLVQKPGAGWSLDDLPPGYTSAGEHTGSDGQTYFKIQVDDPTQATADLELTLKATGIAGDTRVDVKTGSYVEEKTDPASGYEYDVENNTAERTDGTSVSYEVDVLNATLTIKTGWASEGNNDAKHLGGTSDAYLYSGAQAGSTGNEADGVTNAGAPILFSLAGGAGSAEVITDVVFTFDGERGALTHSGPGTLSGPVANPDGTVSYTLSGVDSATIGGVRFVPATSGPESYNDADVAMSYQVTVSNGASSHTFSGTSVVIIDAVADRSGEVVADASGAAAQDYVDAAVESASDADAHGQDGWENDQFSLDYSGVEYNFSVEVITSFPDTDGSERHFILLEQPGGNWSLGDLPAGFAYVDDYTASGGKVYFRIEVEDPTLADVSLTIPLKATGIAGDVDITLATGSYVEEADKTGVEYDMGNNVAVRTDGTSVSYAADVLNATLTVKTGWASEGNNDAKHMESGDSADYSHGGAQAGSTGNEADGVTNAGAPITLGLSGEAGSAEVITDVVFTFDGERGALTYSGPGTLSGPVANPDGTVSYTLSGVDSATIDGVRFVPATSGPESYNDADVAMSYQVTVSNGASTHTFSGTSVVIIDAVADRSTDVETTLTGADSQNYTEQAVIREDDQADHGSDGWETDSFGMDYSQVDFGFTLRVETSFPDTDGSENHYVLVENLGPDWTLGDLPAGYSLVADDHAGSDGKTYYKIQVDDPTQETASLDISFTVRGLSSSTTVPVSTGSYVEEVGRTGVEYDMGNNMAERTDGTSVSYEIDLVNATLTVKTGWASEGNNDAKHLGGTSDAYGYGGAQAGATGNEADGLTNTGAPITLSLAGGAGSIDSVTFTFDDSRGSLWLDGAEYHSGDAIPVNAASLDGLRFVPATSGPESYNDADVGMSYEVTVSHGGASHTFSGTSVVIIDAVADRSEDVVADASGAAAQDYADAAVESVSDADAHGQDGWENDQFGLDYSGVEYTFSVDVSARFPDVDGSEKHYILLEQPGGQWNLGDLPTGFNYVDSYTAGDGKTYFRIAVEDPTLADVSLTIPLKATGITGDVDITLATGSYVEEVGKTGVEYDLGNNVAVRTDGTSVSYAADVLNATLTVKTGWASEGNNDAKHMESGDSADYSYGGAQAGSTGNEADGVTNAGAPITFGLSGEAGSAEVITDVVFSFDGERGALTYSGPGTLNGPVANPDGTVSYTLSGVDSATIDGVRFVPATSGPESYNDADVGMSYQVTVSNGTSTHTFSGTSVVIIDAVADRSTDVETTLTAQDAQSATDQAQINVDDKAEHGSDGWENDSFSLGYGDVEYSFSLNLKTSFPDIDGSEDHYVLVENLGPDWTLGGLPTGYSLVADDHAGSDGKTYYKIQVDDSTQAEADLSITFTAKGVAGTEVTVKTGSYV